MRRGLLLAPLGAFLLCLSLPAPAWAEGDDGGDDAGAEVTTPVPEPGAGSQSLVSFRADFRLGWNLTDGVGMIDHIGMGVTLGPQFGRPRPKGPPAVAPLLAVTAGIAEEGRPSIRITGGMELAFGLAPNLELVPSFFGGYMKAFRDDERAGPMARVALALRVLGDKDFYLHLEPISLVVLPPPPDGFTRYTTHIALDMTIVKFGGRTP